ncbi:MAG: hypothetical protein WAV05_08060 [Anaerolineales bacterium]
MKDQLTTRDYELLSAYLDNQLSDNERALLESRLKTDTALRSELHEISKTRLLLQSLPRLRAPRNYYIQAEAIQTRPNLRLAPIFGIVSAVASVLLAIVIFSSTFFSSSAPVAMAPAPEQPVETITVQQEIQRSGAAQITPTEEAPVTMLGALPMATSTSEAGALLLGEPQVPTPTTIYLNALPPTSTPENLSTLTEAHTEISSQLCEQYYDSGSYPIDALPSNCPSPTPSLTPTSTYSESIQELHSSPTPMDTDTATSVVTPTPTASPTPTPTPMEIAPSIDKSIPTEAAEAPSGLTTPSQVMGAGNPIPSGQEQAVSTQNNTDFSFLNYLLLTVEISLATIAIIAGILAIILRIRSGR